MHCGALENAIKLVVNIQAVQRLITLIDTVAIK